MQRSGFSRSKTAAVSLIAVVISFGVLFGWNSGLVSAQSNEDCLMCHEDPDATGERGGHEVSIFVDPGAFSTSVHADFGCIDCHMELDGAELPHGEELEPVSCGMCHDEVAEQMSKGPHGKWATDPSSPAAACTRCHGTHDVEPIAQLKAVQHENHEEGLCVQCHKRAAREIKGSPHWEMGADGEPGAHCVDCHLGHDVHAPAEPIAQLESCGKCHETQVQQHRESLHGRAAVKGDPLAPACVTCHQHHAIKRSSDPESPTAVVNIPMLCGRCHQEGSEVMEKRDIPQDHILQNFSMSVHGRGLFEQGLTVTAVCTSCHTSHFILDHNHPKSSINRDNVAATCMQCHGRIEQVHMKVIEGRLWEEEPHKVPSCAECHQPHKIRRRPAQARGAANKNCLKCHADENLTMERDGQTISLFVDEERFEMAAHGTTACAQCHTQVNPRHKERACAPITEPVDCSICHAAEVQDYQLSTHGQLLAEGDADVPVCLTCHETHNTMAHRMPTARTFARNVPKLCGECHAAGEVASQRLQSEIPDIVGSYERSAHGKGLLESGLVVSASCVNCHSTHKVLPASDPSSSVSRDNLADTCGQCHKGIEEEFRTSIHWPGNVVTTEKLPVCEDCHTSHTITRVDAQGFRFRMMDQCGHCHEDFAKSFFDTYHGKVTQLGSEGAAKCYDCHGTHGILPVSDPNSMLSHKNVVETCAKCHPKAHRQFAGYLSHATHHDPDKYPFLFYSFWFMTILLVSTLTFAVIHTAMWLFRLWRTREKWGPHKAEAKKATKFYRRFTRRQRLMHGVILLSFFTLALTGMTLKFSYMGWATIIAPLMGGYDGMGFWHRFAAVVMIALFAFHIKEVFRYKGESGQGWFSFIFGKNSMMFNFTDIKQVWQSIMWFLGRGPRPEYGRFTYWEKFDYFAVFWGVGIIGATGFLLWFPEFFTRFLPGASVNVATIIHSDEALLAVGFIFTIHFFNTHFRPDKFPMDPVIFTGRVPIDELKHDKPEEYKELMELIEKDPDTWRVTGPAAPQLEKFARIVGFTALTIGLSLIGLIIYAVIFGYR